MQNAIGGFSDSGMYPFDVNGVDMSKLVSSTLWKSNQHSTVSGPKGDIPDTAIMRSMDSARTDRTQASSRHQKKQLPQHAVILWKLLMMNWGMILVSLLIQ